MINQREFIAKNVASLLEDGDTVNLGIGIPMLVSKYIPQDKTIFIHTENGALGIGKSYGKVWLNQERKEIIDWMNHYSGEKGSWRICHKDLVNAAIEPVTLIPGASCFDSLLSFTIARGRHLDATVLGALQVDKEGNLANWKVPGKKYNGVGGAMDIASGSKRVIVAMLHTTADGTPKLVSKCSLPLTAPKCVTTLVSDLCIIDFFDNKLVVSAIAPGVSKEDIMRRTDTVLVFPSDIRDMIV